MLSLELSLCPSHSSSSFELVKDVQLFARRLACKAICDNKPTDPAQVANSFFDKTSTKKVDFRAIRNLMDLLYEGGKYTNNLEFNYET